MGSWSLTFSLMRILLNMQISHEMHTKTIPSHQECHRFVTEPFLIDALDLEEFLLWLLASNLENS